MLVLCFLSVRSNFKSRLKFLLSTPQFIENSVYIRKTSLMSGTDFDLSKYPTLGYAYAALRYCAYVLVGFFFGYLMRTSPHSSDPLGSGVSLSQKQVVCSTSENVIDYNLDRIDSLSKDPFSCNTRGAYDELTRFYTHRIKLEERMKMGEANRARTATISRKTAQSESAEQAFRTCVKTVMPQVLDLWDKDLRNKNLRIKHILTNYKYDNAGINLSALEKTADELTS